MSDDAVGTTETAAWRFWIVSLTVTRRPFCIPVARRRSRQKTALFPSSSANARGGCSYPVTSGLGNIFTDLLRRETERTDLRGKSRRGTDLTTGRPEVAVSEIIVSLPFLLPISLSLSLSFSLGGRIRKTGGGGREALEEERVSLHDLDLVGVDLGSCTLRKLAIATNADDASSEQ